MHRVSSYTVLLLIVAGFSSADLSQSPKTTTPKAASHGKTQPIPILCTPRDPNRVITPLSGRGDRKGRDYFSLTTKASPQCHDIHEPGPMSIRRRSSSSHLSRSLFILKMPADQVNTSRYTPTSPLSPRLPAAHRRQSSRNAQTNPPHTTPPTIAPGNSHQWSPPVQPLKVQALPFNECLKQSHHD